MPTTYSIRESVRSTHLKDGAVVLDLGEGRLFQLNLVASRILELVKGGVRSDCDITRILGQDFGVEPERCAKDVLEFLRELEGLGLIESRVLTTES